MVQQNCQREPTNSKNPLRDGNTARGENLSGESQGDREEFRSEATKDDEGIHKDFWTHAEARKESDLSSSYWTEKFILRAERRKNHSLFFQGLYYWTKLLREEIFDAERGMERSQNVWGKNKNNCTLILQGKDWILYAITTLRTNSFLWKDLKKALHLTFFEGDSKHILSRLVAQRICETKFFK